jgi:CheY-like chemotaxis protein
VYVADSTDAALVVARLVGVVVTETREPGSMDGLGLVRALRAMPATRHMPIVVVSADGNLSTARAVEAGCV